jgi:Cd2+/Zn2+-exporting ATPase
VIALGVAILPPLLNNGNGWTEWLYRALVLLVIACPCALVISTPVSIMSGLAAAARKGILIKGGVYLETGRSLKWLALDKTGTLTNGNPVQTAFYPWEDNDPALARNIAAKLAGYSDHPVSRAVCQANTVDLPLSDPEEFTALPGRGVRGTINGILYHLGNYELMQELGYSSDQLETKLHELETTGASTAILAGTTSGVMALFGLADTLRKTSRKAIDELHSLGVQTVILTGDNSAAAQIIARQAGVNRVHYGLLPEDKLKIVAELSSEGAVGMVGDGINDAPALAGSTIGFAMGAAGSDIAIETSDVALMDDDLCKIPAFIRLSRNTMRVLRQNMILALGAKLAFLLLAVNGDATMWMAVFADMGISLLVVGNGLRLLRQ